MKGENQPLLLLPYRIHLRRHLSSQPYGFFSGLEPLTFDYGGSASSHFSISRPVRTRPNSAAHPPHPSDCPGGPAACPRPRHRPASPSPQPARRPAPLPARHPRLCPPPLSPRPHGAPGRAAGGRRGAPRLLAAPPARAQPEGAAQAWMPRGEGGGRARGAPAERIHLCRGGLRRRSRCRCCCWRRLRLLLLLLWWVTVRQGVRSSGRRRRSRSGSGAAVVDG